MELKPEPGLWALNATLTAPCPPGSAARETSSLPNARRLRPRARQACASPRLRRGRAMQRRRSEPASSEPLASHGHLERGKTARGGSALHASTQVTSHSHQRTVRTSTSRESAMPDSRVRPKASGIPRSERREHFFTQTLSTRAGLDRLGSRKSTNPHSHPARRKKTGGFRREHEGTLGRP